MSSNNRSFRTSDKLYSEWKQLAVELYGLYCYFESFPDHMKAPQNNLSLNSEAINTPKPKANPMMRKKLDSYLCNLPLSGNWESLLRFIVQHDNHLVNLRQLINENHQHTEFLEVWITDFEIRFPEIAFALHEQLLLEKTPKKYVKDELASKSMTETCYPTPKKNKPCK